MQEETGAFYTEARPAPARTDVDELRKTLSGVVGQLMTTKQETTTLPQTPPESQKRTWQKRRVVELGPASIWIVGQ